MFCSKKVIYFKVFIMLVAVIMLILCTGCSAQQQDDLNRSGSSGSMPSFSSSSSDEPSDSTTSPSSVSAVEDDYSTNNELSSSNSNDNDGNPESDQSGMSYMDYVITYRDEIIDGAIDVEYEHFVAHPTGLKDGYVKFSGEIMQVFEDQAYGYDFYAVLMNITFVPGTYSSHFTDTVLISVVKDFSAVYPSVGDIATVWGMSKGFLTYENIFGEAVGAPHILAAQISYDSHPDTVSSNVATDFAATDLLGLTVDEIAAIRGHSPSDYIVEEDSNYHMAFHADDALILYSLSGYTSGTVRSIDVKAAISSCRTGMELLIMSVLE